MLETILVTAAAGVGGTGLGGGAACLFRRDSGRLTSLLLSFAGGVMVSVVCFGLLTDAASANAPALLTLGVLGGCGVTAALNGLLAKEREGLLLAGLVMAAAIAVHNVPEGMVIGASFAAGETIRQGWTMAVVIGLHNIPEGMAIAAPLAAGGQPRWKAAGLAALTGAPTVLGAALGYRLGSMGPYALMSALSFAAGAMLYVVFGELLPEAAALCQTRAPALFAILGVLTGMAVT